jgi:hypothetical protein
MKNPIKGDGEGCSVFSHHLGFNSVCRSGKVKKRSGKCVVIKMD